MAGEKSPEVDLTKPWMKSDLIVIADKESKPIYVCKDVLKTYCPRFYVSIEDFPESFENCVEILKLERWSFAGMFNFMELLHMPWKDIRTVKIGESVAPIAHFYKALTVLQMCDTKIATKTRPDFESLLFAEEFALQKSLDAASSYIAKSFTVFEIENHPKHRMLTENIRVVILRKRCLYLEQREKKLHEGRFSTGPKDKLHTIL